VRPVACTTVPPACAGAGIPDSSIAFMAET
jgi:hypothetical protein